jgi:uncharacterized membrane protein YhaH (DUF805 family)
VSWQFYLSPDGRVTRAQWWQKLFLPILVIIVLAMILDAILGWRPRQSPIGILTILVSWLTIYPTVVVSVKRLHDHNKSGWWYLMYLIPLVGWIWSIIECGCLRGTVGDNRYGPDLLPFLDSSTRSLHSAEARLSDLGK